MGARRSSFDCVAVIEGGLCSAVRANSVRSKLQLSSQDIKTSPQVRAARSDAVSLCGGSFAAAEPHVVSECDQLRRPGLCSPAWTSQHLWNIPDWCRPDAGRPVKPPQHEWEEPGKGAPHVTRMHLGRPHTGADTWDISQHPSVSQGPHSEPSLPYQRVFGRCASTTERKKSQHFSSLLIQFFTWSNLNIYGRRCR